MIRINRYAANVLVYPPGDWYGSLTPADVPAFLDALSPTPKTMKENRANASLASSTSASARFLMSHWRGRMGLDKAAAQEIYEKGMNGEAAVDDSSKRLEVELRPKERTGEAAL